jgi:hypothetical protein
MTTIVPMLPTIALGQIIRTIQSNRFSLSGEKQTQVQIGDALAAAGIPFEREVRLSDEDIVDFMVDGIAVEVKIKGQRKAIYRQLERYAAHERVRAVLLVTAVSMQLPPAINSKPAKVASLGAGWL